MIKRNLLVRPKVNFVGEGTMVKSIWKKLLRWVNAYPIVISVLGIYAYYLFTTLNLFKKSEVTRLSFSDFIVHYDSLIWMWLVVYLYFRAQTIKKKYESNELSRNQILSEVEKSSIASVVLHNVIHLLQDAINNPLAIIGSTTEEIRRQSSSDPRLNRQFDQIEASLQRIHNAIKDVQVYESTELLEQLHKQVTP
jgi:signal transduction histidine kinase